MIGFFGLTANPPHFSHCYAIREALKVCDTVYVSLVYQHPFGKQFISYPERMKMFLLIQEEYFSEHELARIKLSELDKQYVQETSQVPYSYNLLKKLQQCEPHETFKLIIGADNYVPEVWHRFSHYQEIEKEFGLIIIPERASHSTQIREKMKNPDENRDFLISNCGELVFNYMKANNLY